jgi:hypothetical protein
MDEYIQGCQLRQARRVNLSRQRLLEDQDLCLATLLPRAHVEAVLANHQVRFRQCLYTPVVTLWMFLYQVLAPDQSCRAAVTRLLAFLGVATGRTGSTKTDPYCKARQRLPEALPADLVRHSGQALDRQINPMNGLDGRPIKIADGTTVSMPDTEANQAAYPQPTGQRKGLGFPLMRLVALTSLSCGAVLDVAMGRYSGKQTGETSLLRTLMDRLSPNDILLGDAIFGNYWTMALLLTRGVDLLTRHDGKRRLDFRRGRRLGRYDRVVTWFKPRRPAWMAPELYAFLPETLSIRQVRVEIRQKGFRCRRLHLITTLLEADLYPRDELALAFRCRWHAELDLRSIKTVMQMDVLRCKSPAMVRKEIWMHLLAYNLIRTLMVQAAREAGVSPRDLSFKGTLQTLMSFAMAGWGCPGRRPWLYAVILRAVATYRVNDRPDRIEPRAVKRRPKKAHYLTEPRPDAKARLRQGTYA